MMLRHGLGLESEAAAVESGVEGALAGGLRTPDLGGERGHGAGDAGQCSTTSNRSAMNVEPTDLIWMNGEFVAWEDAKVHVLTHGLHYGTGVFDSMRCYDTRARAGGVPQRRAHRSPAALGRALLHAGAVLGRAAARGDARAGRAQRAALLLHPPDRQPRLRPDGAQPARGAGRRDDRLLGVGRLPRRGGQARRRARQGVLLAADQRRTR